MRTVFERTFVGFIAGLFSGAISIIIVPFLIGIVFYGDDLRIVLFRILFCVICIRQRHFEQLQTIAKPELCPRYGQKSTANHISMGEVGR